MSAKVRIKAGPVEFEYEGETELSINDIKDLFSHIETLFTVPALGEASEPHADQSGGAEVPATPKPPNFKPKLHVNSMH